MRNYRKLILLVFIILITASFILSFFYSNTLENLISRGAQVYGEIILFLFAFAIELIPNYISPHLIFFISTFLKISLTTALILTICGSTIGSLIGFEVGRKLGYDYMKEFFPKKRFQKAKKFLEDKGKFAISIAAISPLPYFPFLIGALPFKRITFYIYGIIPRMIGLIVAGIVIYHFF